MPRVSQAHLDARQREILAAAHRAFARHGFREATMQQVADGAGLSVGALYRYFEGKEALIEALAAWGEAQKRELMASLGEGSGPEALVELVARMASQLPPDDEARDTVRFDVRLWGEALGQPPLEALVRESLAGFRALVTDQVRDAQEAGRLRREVDAETVARLLVSLLTGLELQVAYEPELEREAYVRAVGTLLGSLAYEPE